MGSGSLRDRVGGTPTPRAGSRSPLDRHAGGDWVEWTLREFARYIFVLVGLAALVMGPLQMAASWLPSGRPPVVAPALVGGMAIAFVSGVLYLGFEGYRFLWAEGGWVDRAVARREAREPQDPETSRGGG